MTPTNTPDPIPPVPPPIPGNMPSQPTDEERDGPPWWTMAIFLLAAILLVALFGWSISSLPLLFIEMLLALSALSVGGLFGFLFGMPRGTGDSSSKEDTTADGSMPYRPSNNLEQISDWLTKILIGVGLVELREIGVILAQLGHLVAGSLSIPPPGTEVVTQAVVIAFLILGFLASFLWTRIYYGRLQTIADNNVRLYLQSVRSTLVKVQAQLKDQKLTTQNVEAVTASMARGELNIRGITTATEQSVRVMQDEKLKDWLPDVQTRISAFQAAKAEWDTDPGADIFPNAPREANGRKLEIDLFAKLKDDLALDLRVIRSGGLPLDDTVVFLLHPTFLESILYITPTGDKAETKIYAEGWFTVVAIMDKGKTILSYKLKDLPDAPEWFKEEGSTSSSSF